MLGKLLRYEIKSTARLFLPLYAALLILGLLNRLFLAVSRLHASNFVLALPATTVTVFYVLTAMAAFVMTLVVMIQRFYKNLLGDEGYLMFTLPVTPVQHLVTKLLVSCLWIFASVAVMALSLVAMLADRQFFAGLWPSLCNMFSSFSFSTTPSICSVILYGVEFIVLILLGTISSILMIYFSISLGQLFNRNKLLAAVGAYLVINTALQVLSSLLFIPLSFPNVNGILTSFLTANPYLSLHLALGAGILGALLLSTAFFLGTNYLLSRKLNLE